MNEIDKKIQLAYFFRQNAIDPQTFVDKWLEISGVFASKEIVICAAIRMPDGYIVRGHRHADAIATARGIPRYKDALHPQFNDQGFVTSLNRYINRTEGCEIQRAAGVESVCKNPNDKYLGGELYSEDLY